MPMMHTNGVWQRCNASMKNSKNVPVLSSLGHHSTKYASISILHQSIRSRAKKICGCGYKISWIKLWTFSSMATTLISLSQFARLMQRSHHRVVLRRSITCHPAKTSLGPEALGTRQMAEPGLHCGASQPPHITKVYRAITCKLAWPW